MNVKLKCVDSLGCDYLTSRKIYDAIMDDKDAFALVDDDGDLIRDSIDPKEMYYANWEVVN